jgi:hypothetical protein
MLFRSDLLQPLKLLYPTCPSIFRIAAAFGPTEILFLKHHDRSFHGNNLNLIYNTLIV